MNSLLKFNIILAIVFAMVQVYAADDTTLNAEFLTGKYEDNQIIDEWIGIRGVDGLEVRVEGEIEENYDFIIIYNKRNCVIRRLSGVMNTVFTVPGSSIIRVIFKSDQRTTKDGARVTVFPLSPASFFNEIKAQSLEASTHILKKGTDKIYVDIVQHLAKFKDLYRKVETPEQKIGPLTEDILVHLIAMTKSYRQIATTSKSIMATHQSQLKIIEQLRKKTHAQIDKITKERERLRKEQEKLLSKIETGSIDPIERQKKEYTNESYEKNIDSLNRLQKVWEDFDGVQNTLKDQLKAYSDNIGLLLHFLKVDAETYKQVTNVISLRKTEVIALDNLPDLSKLSKLRGVIAQIQNGEKEILEQLEKIKQTNF
ncbi:MAG: hypothetical protein BWK79_12650 [Beggiatoa sp. IS2]|nr:MAG: hypothetical protein BWK79_12650 [Beggiatoa sp. IS2]